MNTTYNLTPEEKLQVFASKYRSLETDTSIVNPMFPDPWKKFEEESVEPKKEDVEETTIEDGDISFVLNNPEEEKKQPSKEDAAIKEPRITDLHLGVGDQLLTNTKFFHAHDGKEGLYADRADPKSVQHNAIHRARGYKPNNISAEIDKLDLSQEDKQYLKLLQYMEGGGDYKIENKEHFKGLYQFGNDALKTVGMSTEDYMSNPTNQHIAALKLKDHNLNKSGLRKYIGMTINGIKLTENKLAVALHASGLLSVKRWIESNGTQVPVDRNNFPMTAYLTIF